MAYQVIWEKNQGSLQGKLPVVVQGSTLETITILALYRDGTAIDLSSMTLSATATDRDENTTAISGTLTGLNGSFTWDFSAGDVGTAEIYEIIVTYTDGVDSWDSDPVRFTVRANPAITAIQNDPPTGVTTDERAWLTVQTANGEDVGDKQDKVSPPPSAGAIHIDDGTGQAEATDQPRGFFMQRDTVAADETVTIPASYQMIVASPFTNDGTIVVDGRLIII